MNGFMDWGECEREFIREVEPDFEKIKSIIKTADARLNFIKNISANKENVSFVVENYYEIVKELLVALLLKDGLRSKNHQCLISYFYRKHPKYEAEAHLISRMSYFRNRLDYYGEAIEFAFYDKYKKDFERIINILKDLLK
ncbi:MAG: hypothetical protein UU67_C0021G0012 [Candidatus Daviesbacteria bacterium GW2011_GWB1_41_5]|uniref:HEPN domain-containing protein n=1 Tax=Candidatus Daviesbacteria bacterium GW2011_GWB1_41_5 TaxID=1618429 RepID=A0A0G0WLH0_9BACT|nr:MAG: hypothetical protein UU67_C0021G0012 [Candidatus Daviesbacteria bacterium GW2011_GWB1_41_5]HIH13924.1 hypothetical protein [Nanoarchaeota archaeon]